MLPASPAGPERAPSAAPRGAALLVPLLAGLQQQVVTFVERRRRDGAPVDLVLLEVAALVRDTAAEDGRCAFAELLVASVARWSAAAYER